MNTSPETFSDEDTAQIRGSEFAHKNFWEWVEGVELRTIPITGTKIICIEEPTPAVEWGDACTV